MVATAASESLESDLQLRQALPDEGAAPPPEVPTHGPSQIPIQQVEQLREISEFLGINVSLFSVG